MMNLGLRTRILGGIFVPVLMLFVVGGTAVFGIYSTRDTQRWVTHTYQVIEQADAILAGAVDMETGMRGFVLAGKDNFLEPFETGQKRTFTGIENLKAKVSDNPAQVERLEEIRVTLTDWKTKVADENIKLRREINLSKSVVDLAKRVGEKRGKVFFDKFRGQIQTFIDREIDLLEKRQANFRVENASPFEIREAQQWVTHTYKVIIEAQKILAAAIDMETGMRGFLLAGEEEFLEPYENGRQNFNALSIGLAKTVDDNPAQVQLIGEARQTIDEWRQQVVDPMIELRRQIEDGKTMDDMAALIAQEKGKIYFDKFRADLGIFIATEKELLVQRDAEQEAAITRTYWMILFVGIAAVIMSSVIGVYLSRSVLNQVGGEPDHIAALTDKVANGDLRLNFGSEKRMTGILHSLRGMVDNMRTVHLSIVGAADRISSSVKDIAGSSNSQASGAAEQAAALNEIVTTLDEMQRTSQETLDKATALGESAALTQEEGEQGIRVLREMMASMEGIRNKVEKIAEANLELSEHSKNIGQITATINHLMQQSKMLGINASIEASKAGEAGKGFAVVAEEIHSLAEQSEQSTEQVHRILSEVQRATENAVMSTEEGSKEVAQGLRLIEQASYSIEKLNTVINDTATRSDEIVNAVRQATMGIDQVSAAMAQINDTTQNFVDTTNQVRDASEGLSVVVDELSQSVSIYKV